MQAAVTVGGLIAVPVLAACGGGSAATPTAAPAGLPPAAPTSQPITAPITGVAEAPTATAAVPIVATAAPTAAPAASGAAPRATPTFVPVTKQLPQPATSPAKVTGKWTVLQNQDFNPEFNAYVRKAITDFAKFQGWPLDVSYVAGFSAGGQLEQKLAAAINAGTPPDLMGNNQNGYQYKSLGLIEPVDDIAKEMIRKYGDVTPGIQYSTLVDGVWYGVPWFTRNGTAYWARQSWFQDAGLDPVRATDALDGLADALLRISDPAKKRYGWGMTVNTSGDGEHLVQCLSFMFGSRLTDEQGQVVTLDSPETVKAVQWLTDIYTNPKWKNMLPPGVNGWTDPSNNEAWLSGQIGYTQNAGTLYAQSVQQGKALEQDTVLLQQPAGPGGTRLMGQDGNEFWIFKGSKNIEASKDFIRYMLDPTAQRATWDYTPGYVMPAYASGWSDPIVQGNRIDAQVQSSALAKPAFLVPSYPGPATAAAAAVNSVNVYTKMIARVFQGMKPQDSVKQAAQDAVQVYQQYGLKGK